MMFSKMIAFTTLIAVALTIASLLASFALAAAHPSWSEYKQQFGKKYATPEEESRREVTFQTNMRRAAELAKRNPLAAFGANEYTDMSADEFKVYHNADRYFKGYAAKRSGAKLTSFTAEQDAARPTSVDWRSKGAVTYVKNQGQCGSCWSFSTTGNIEGQWFLAGNKLVALSEQEFVSCDTIDSGCNGGLMDNAFTWVVQSRGGWVTLESAYPYVSGAGQVPACSISGKPKVAQITGHQDFQNSESAMATALSTNGPISIGVDASSWQTYSGGILTDCTSTQVDHGVLLVGYDLSYSTPYWIIKNSWGPSWGEQGFIRVAYGSDQCLITTAPSSSIAGSGPAPSNSGSGSGSTNPPTAPPSNSGSGSTNPPSSGSSSSFE
jgi:cysteine peptidase B